MNSVALHRTVLVVEDDDDLRDLIADVLRARGHTVRCARGGSEGLACLRETGFELILLDLTLPDMSGVEFLALRQQIPQADIPVVVMSGAVDARAIGDRRKFPVLRKPFGISDLLSCVEVEPIAASTS